MWATGCVATHIEVKDLIALMMEIKSVSETLDLINPWKGCPPEKLLLRDV
jgi:hypothetical protein